MKFPVSGVTEKQTDFHLLDVIIILNKSANFNQLNSLK